MTAGKTISKETFKNLGMYLRYRFHAATQNLVLVNHTNGTRLKVL